MSPDVGGVQRTRGLATKIKADLAIMTKEGLSRKISSHEYNW